jgi:hypothetical protein
MTIYGLYITFINHWQQSFMKIYLKSNWLDVPINFIWKQDQRNNQRLQILQARFNIYKFLMDYNM